MILRILAILLAVCWIAGMLVQPLGGFIHVLAGLAAIALTTELALGWRRRRQAEREAATLIGEAGNQFNSPAA